LWRGNSEDGSGPVRRLSPEHPVPSHLQYPEFEEFFREKRGAADISLDPLLQDLNMKPDDQTGLHTPRPDVEDSDAALSAGMAAAFGASGTGSHHSASEPDAGAVIAGKYTLVESIGEGGMGSVWRAKQTEPVKRFVAVKLIKAGMDSKQVLARFEAERQALALMDHPNIAKVLDGGVTSGEPGGVSPGRPYFVMELVKGVPVTEYCDRCKLTPQGAVGTVRAGVPGDPARAPEGHHPPRHQTVECADRPV